MVCATIIFLLPKLTIGSTKNYIRGNELSLAGHKHSASDVIGLPAGINTEITAMLFSFAQWNSGKSYTMNISGVPSGSRIRCAIVTLTCQVANDITTGTSIIMTDSYFYREIGMGNYSYYGTSQVNYVGNRTYISVIINNTSLVFQDSADYTAQHDTRYGMADISALVLCTK